MDTSAILPVVPTRSVGVYTQEEQTAQALSRTILQCQLTLNQTKEDNAVHDNQKKAASDVVDVLCDLTKVWTLVLGNTQSGKTGVMISLIDQMMTHPTLSSTPIENICVITALSSVDWMDQTKGRFPECLDKQVFHLPGLLKKFVPYAESRSNMIIMLDEAQYGAKSGQSLHKAFSRLGFTDLETLMKRNIHIVMFSATPSGVNYTLDDWGVHGARVILDEGTGYVSAADLMVMGKLRQYKDLCGINSTGEQIVELPTVEQNLAELRTTVLSFQTPRYHIIRTPTRKQMKTTFMCNIRRTLHDVCEFVSYDMITTKKQKQKQDINVMLREAPEKHTIIFIKETLRCAKTIFKKFIGVMVERHTSSIAVSDEVIIQGVRLTGYDYNGDAIMFTNIDSVEKYKKLSESKFKDKSIKWKSSTTLTPRGPTETTPRTTFMKRSVKN